MTAKSPHVASFSAIRPAFESELGSVTQLDAASLPTLSGLSIKRIILEPGAIREPQWNVNANQLAYCISGTVLVATLGNADSFSLAAGFGIPSATSRGSRSPPSTR